jgi:hypothetical protein
MCNSTSRVFEALAPETRIKVMTALRVCRGSSVPVPGPGLQSLADASDAWFQRAADVAFVEMLDAYRSSGGLARESEALERYLACGGSLCNWRHDVNTGRILSFEWDSQGWIPMFQFQRRDMSVKPLVTTVTAELTTVFAGWDLARWFAQPNNWLEECRPVDLLESGSARVLAAARADRYIAAG